MKFKKSVMFSFMLYFQFKFLRVNILKKFEEFIMSLRSLMTEFANKSLYSIILIRSWWSKWNSVFNIFQFEEIKTQVHLKLSWVHSYVLFKHKTTNCEKVIFHEKWNLIFKVLLSKNLLSTPLDLQYTDDSKNATHVFFL